MASPTHVLLSRLFHLLLTLFPSSTWQPDYATRLLQLCLLKLKPLFEQAEGSSSGITGGMNGVNGIGGGRKGKKRARGEEDGLVASLEGKVAEEISEEDSNLAIEVLECKQSIRSLYMRLRQFGDGSTRLICLVVPLLHTTPLLPPSLLTLSIRTHLSLYLALPSYPSRRFAETSHQSALIESVRIVLEEACLMTEEGGQSRGWKSVILSVLEPSNADRLSLPLHPQVPPLVRPAPPLGALHFFTAESEEEQKHRQDIGLTTATDPESAGGPDTDGMDVDDASGSAAETIVVPVNPRDVRAGKHDISQFQSSSGTLHVQPPNTPQPGHHPPNPVTQTNTQQKLTSPIIPKINFPPGSISSSTPARASYGTLGVRSGSASDKPVYEPIRIDSGPKMALPTRTLAGVKGDPVTHLDSPQSGKGAGTQHLTSGASDQPGAISIEQPDLAVERDEAAATEAQEGAEIGIAVRALDFAAGSSESKGKGKAVEDASDEEGIPELDSELEDGFSDDDEEEEEEEEEEEQLEMVE